MALNLAGTALADWSHLKKPLSRWGLEAATLIKDSGRQQLFLATGHSEGGPGSGRYVIRVIEETEPGRQLWQALCAYELPHVVQILACQSYEGKLFILERFVKGQTLSGCMKRPGHFAKAEILLAGIQLVRALRVLYVQEGILHLDIKPENLMVDAHNNVTLLDFGAAVHRVERLDLLRHDQYGTIGYTAPERWLSPNDTGPLSDLHSLARTLRLWLEGQGHVDFELWQTLLWWEEQGLHRLGESFERGFRESGYYECFEETLNKGLTT